MAYELFPTAKACFAGAVPFPGVASPSPDTPLSPSTSSSGGPVHSQFPGSRFIPEGNNRSGWDFTTHSLILKVLNGIMKQMPIFLTFPYDKQCQSEVKRGFHGIVGMSNTVFTER